MSHRAGKQSIVLDNPVYIISEGTVVGKKEGEGPLKNYFDMIVSDDKMGQKSWDLAEGIFQKYCGSVCSGGSSGPLRREDCHQEGKPVQPVYEEYFRNCGDSG